MKNIFNVLETPCLIIAAITNILIFVLCGTVNSYSQPNIYVDPCNQVVYGQKTVTVNFRISNVTNVRTYGVSFKFNNSIIKFKSAIKGPFLNNNGSYSTFFGTQPSGTYINDSVTVAESILGAGIAVSGSGLLFSVQFDILSTGQSPISIKGITLYDINNNLITGAFTSGYVTIAGKILVVDDEVTFDDKVTSDKTINPLETNKKILVSPLGASTNLFTSSLTSAGYFVEQVNFNSLNTNNLVNYDVVVLSAGIKENLIFNDVTKRTALINYTQAGGKILVEGGEVGYVFRKEEPNDLDPEFRRNILLDSAWISNRIGANLQIVNSAHPIFTTPNVINSPINVNDGGATGSGARDEMTLHNTTGISRIANWTGGLPENAGIIIYNPNGDTAKCHNIFFTFSIAQFADQVVAGKLIVNSVRYLLRDAFLPAKTLNITSLIEGFYDGTSMIPDTITVELKDTLAPFTLLESKKTILNNLGYGTLIYYHNR